jgi:NADH-quinone oxidoreductase subunit E
MSTVDPGTALNPADRTALAALAAHARNPGIEALQYVQSRYRWVSDAHLAEIADLLHMPRAELEGVATFYNLIFRRPVGEKIIFLCDSVSCWILGREQVCAHLCKRLGIQPGETTADQKYTLLPIVCLGHCDHAPALLWGDDLHGDVDAAHIDLLLGQGSQA